MRCCSTIFTLLLLAGSLVGSLAAQVRIAEFMANNNLVLADAEGDWPDWIELENVGTSSVNLGGWYLTDSANKPTKWQLPSPTTLGAGQRLVDGSHLTVSPDEGGCRRFRIAVAPLRE